MTTLRIISALTIALWAVIPGGLAKAACPSSGIGTTLKLPLVRAHAPCGYQGRHPDSSTTWGPACSPAATGLKKCTQSHQFCASNSDCSADFCYSVMPSGGSLGPCDSQSGCSPCEGRYCPGQENCLDGYGPNTCDVNADGLYQSNYQFAPNGSCTLVAKSKIVSDCASISTAEGNLPAGPCQVTYFTVRCKDILRGDGTPISGPDDGFALNLTARLTLDNGSTVLDLPFSFYPHQPSKGSMTFTGDTATGLASMFSGGDKAALPPCTTIEIVGAQIIDPVGAVFATVGLATQ